MKGANQVERDVLTAFKLCGISLPRDYFTAIVELVARAEAGEPLPVLADEVVISFGKYGVLDLGAVISDLKQRDRRSSQRKTRGRKS